MKLLITGLLLASSTWAWANYENHFPEYFEYCTGTQLKYTPEYFEGAVGGPGGHGFMYIHGLCKDYSKSYPQVTPCDKSSTHEGVGISLDSDYSNVAWVAIPGRNLTMFGNIEPRAVTEEDIQDVANKAHELKIFQNVKLKPSYVNKHAFNSPEYEKAAAIYSIGTDIAVNWGRELRCVRIPVTKSAISAAASFLNSVNNKYYDSKNSYEWSMLKNNCTHLAVNTSHAMGINSSIETDKSTARQLLNLAVPSNAYLMYVDKAVIKSPKEERIVKSDSFKKFGFYPAQVGSIMIHMPAFPSSVLFKTSKLVAFTLPRQNPLRFLATPASYDRFAKDKNTDLKANALKWKEFYQEMRPENKATALYIDSQTQLVDKIIKEE